VVQLHIIQVLIKNIIILDKLFYLYNVIEMGASSSKASSDSAKKTNISVLNSTDIGISEETYNKVKNTCESTTEQKNVLNIIGSNVTKVKTNQKNAAKNTCILQTVIPEIRSKTGEYAAMMSNIQDKLAQAGSAGLGMAANAAKGSDDTNISQTNMYSFKASNKTVNETIAGCIMSVDQENVINIVGSNVTDSEFNQENDSVMQCLSASGVAEPIKNPFGDSDSGAGSAGAGAGSGSGSADKDSSASPSKPNKEKPNTLFVAVLIFGISILIISIILSIMFFMSKSSKDKGRKRRYDDYDDDYDRDRYRDRYPPADRDRYPYSR
jgi:hypothetical protein